MKESNSTNYRDWLEKGRHSLADSQRLLEDGGYTDTICFLAHQAAEKYLKGYLVFKKINPRKIHRLDELAKDCAKLDKDFLNLFDQCLTLTRYYIETRYPPLVPIEYSGKEAVRAVEIAEEISIFIEEKLRK